MYEKDTQPLGTLSIHDYEFLLIDNKTLNYVGQAGNIESEKENSILYFNLFLD